MAQDFSTHKIGLWVANDETLYTMARDAENGAGLESSFLDLCEEVPEFAMQILMDLLNSVDWQDIWEAQKNE